MIYLFKLVIFQFALILLHGIPLISFFPHLLPRFRHGFLQENFAESEPCAVCRDVMRCGDLVRRLPCLHVFHASCIARWLCVRATCPLDNSKVLQQLRPTERTETERIQVQL